MLDFLKETANISLDFIFNIPLPAKIILNSDQY